MKSGLQECHGGESLHALYTTCTGKLWCISAGHNRLDALPRAILSAAHAMCTRNTLTALFLRPPEKSEEGEGPGSTLAYPGAPWTA